MQRLEGTQWTFHFGCDGVMLSQAMDLLLACSGARPPLSQQCVRATSPCSMISSVFGVVILQCGVWGQIVGLSLLHDPNVRSFGDDVVRMSFALQIDTFGPESTTFVINIPVQSSRRIAASKFR